MNLHTKAGVFKQGLQELDAMVKQTEQAVLGGAEAISMVTDNVNFSLNHF